MNQSNNQLFSIIKNEIHKCLIYPKYKSMFYFRNEGEKDNIIYENINSILESEPYIEDTFYHRNISFYRSYYYNFYFDKGSKFFISSEAEESRTPINWHCIVDLDIPEENQLWIKNSLTRTIPECEDTEKLPKEIKDCLRKITYVKIQ